MIDSIIDDIFNYISEKLNNPVPLKNNWTIYVFFSLIKSVHKDKIQMVISYAIEKIINLFSKNNTTLSLNLS